MTGQESNANPPFPQEWTAPTEDLQPLSGLMEIESLARPEEPSGFVPELPSRRWLQASQ